MSGGVAHLELLEVWEAGCGAASTERALLLHAVARRGCAVDELLGAPVAQRDADLFALRRSWFGERMPMRLTCPGCREEMEFEFGAGAVAGSAARTAPVRVEADEWTVLARLPTSGDLLAVAHAAGSTEAGQLLLARCVLEASRAGRPTNPEDLPPEVRERVAMAVADADPCADVRLSVVCPECGHSTQAELDIGSYLWAELDTWARETLVDVHLLACTYGWTESDILALSPLRRRRYLELAGHA